MEQENDSEVHILLEDQHKINQFARLHRKLEELEEDAKAKKNEMQTLDDASAEILMLADDDEQVAYQIGEMFVYMTQSEVQDLLEESKEKLNADVSVIGERIDSLKSQMSDLKTHLYAKLGNAINLEAGDD